MGIFQSSSGTVSSYHPSCLHLGRSSSMNFFPSTTGITLGLAALSTGADMPLNRAHLRFLKLPRDAWRPCCFIRRPTLLLLPANRFRCVTRRRGLLGTGFACGRGKRRSSLVSCSRCFSKRSRAPAKTCPWRSVRTFGPSADGSLAGSSLSSAVAGGQACDTYPKIFPLARSDCSVVQMYTP